MPSGAPAAVGGTFSLRGRNWARRCVAVSIGGHVALGFLHPVEKLVVHVAIFAPCVRSQRAGSSEGARGGADRAPGAR